jgi:LmbE family N-acetylglucosaminyl deacetylase
MAPIRIMAVGPHPDDVESSIGGTLALAVRAGYQVTILCSGIAPELPRDRTSNVLEENSPRLQEARQGAAVLGAHLAVIALYPYMGDAAACEALVGAIRTHQPQIVLVNHAQDVHPFHAQVGRWVIEACFLAQLGTVQEASSPWTVAQIYSYKAFTGRAFVPDTYIDVTPTFALARRALRCHRGGLAMLPGLVYWSEVHHTSYGLQVARPYVEGLRRIAGAHWDHLENRLVGMRFVLTLNELALNLATAGKA